MSTVQTEYYRSGNVLVTNTVAELDGKTFAMANVTSVSMSTMQPNNGWALILAGVGALVVLVGLFALGNGGGFAGLVVGLIVFGVGILWSRALAMTLASGNRRPIPQQQPPRRVA